MFNRFFKFYFGLVLLTVLTPSVVGAVSSRRVWMTPSDATVGEMVQINASIYNDTNQSLVIDVLFKTSEKTIKKFSAFLIPAQATKNLAVDYVLPSTSETITVEIKNSQTKDGKKVASFDGMVGVVELRDSFSSKPINSEKIKNFFQNIFSKIENFRIKQYQKFSNLNEKNKEIWGQTSLQDVRDAFKSNKNEPSQSANPEQKNQLQKNWFGYLQLAYSSLLKGLFGQKVIFYVVFFLLVLYILRIIFGRLL